MGRRGPKPTPTAKLRLTGSSIMNRRTDARNDDLATTPARPEAPAWIAGEPRAVFDQLADYLEAVPGLLTAQDAEALAQLAHAIVEFRAHSQQLAVEGFTTETAEGGLKAHPLVSIRQQAWARCRLGFAHFGLSPADRANLKLTPADDSAKRKAIGLGPAGGA